MVKLAKSGLFWASIMQLLFTFLLGYRDPRAYREGAGKRRKDRRLFGPPDYWSFPQDIGLRVNHGNLRPTPVQMYEDLNREWQWDMINFGARPSPLGLGWSTDRRKITHYKRQTARLPG